MKLWGLSEAALISLRLSQKLAPPCWSLADGVFWDATIENLKRGYRWWRKQKRDNFCNLEIELVLGVEKCLSKMVEILNGVSRTVGSWEDFV